MTAAAINASFAARTTPAKLARRVASLVRKAGLTYEDWRRMNKMVRKLARLRPTKRPKTLPNILTADQLRKFFKAVDKAGNTTHAVLMRTLYYTGARVAELVALTPADFDLATGRVRITQGKGKKDRVALVPSSFCLVLRAFLDAATGPRAFMGRQGPLTTRRVEQIVSKYAEAAGVEASPHTFRHSIISALTAAGMTDSQLQPLTGHADKRTLSVYQHVALGPAIMDAYEKAMEAQRV